MTNLEKAKQMLYDVISTDGNISNHLVNKISKFLEDTTKETPTDLNALIAKSEEVGFIKGMNNAKNICEKELKRIEKVQKEEQQFTEEEFSTYKECLDNIIIEILKDSIK